MSAVKDVVRISNVNSANQVIIFIIVEKTILAGMQNIYLALRLCIWNAYQN